MSKLEELKKTMKQTAKLLEEAIDEITPTDVKNIDEIRSQYNILSAVGKKASEVAYWADKFADIRLNFLDCIGEIKDTEDDFLNRGEKKL